MSTESFSVAVLLLLALCCSFAISNTTICTSSSCGNIRNITFPFRLQGDPQHCGPSYPNIVLDCGYCILSYSDFIHYCYHGLYSGQNPTPCGSLYYEFERNCHPWYGHSNRAYCDSLFPDFDLGCSPIPCRSPDLNPELVCQNNQTIISIERQSFDNREQENDRFYVQSINYSGQSIRVVDPSLANINSTCVPFPKYPSRYGYGYGKPNIPVAYLTCMSPLNSSNFIETQFCDTAFSTDLNLSRPHTYVGVVGETAHLVDLGDSCSVEMVALVSSSGPLKDDNQRSLSSIKQGLAYGFDLSWSAYPNGYNPKPLSLWQNFEEWLDYAFG